jgi:hypothetical protein
MRIDRTHRSWAIATAITAVAATVIYVLYSVNSPSGPRGGSAWGLTFGVAGYALMLYAGLLGARKKIPTWRIGRAQTWMRGHLWLGLLSLLLILFHGGFAFRGPLTLALMLLLFIVIVSGITGAVIQHYVPDMMTSRVPMETIYEEIPQVRAQLQDEADQLAATICGPLNTGVGQPAATAATLVEIENEDRARFREIYLQRVRPHLADPRGSAEVLEALRRLLPAAVSGVLDDLENICEEERQLSRQIRIYQWLHGWLLVHVPLSIALLVLGGVHAVMALRY